MSPLRVDIAIAGGGPVGCAAAILQARTGRSVLVLERGTFERRLPGERLVPEVLPALDTLGVVVETHESPGIVSLWGGGEPIVKPALIHPLGGGHAVARPALDQAFADAAKRAGATLRTGARMRSIASSADGWRIEVDIAGEPVEVHAGFLMDATGRAATVARRLGATLHRSDDLVAALAWIPAGSADVDRFRMLHIEAVDGGWVYAVTVDHDTVVAGAVAHRGDHGIDHRALLAGAIGRSELLARQVTTPISAPRLFPASPALTWPPAGPGWIAIGDAASQLDPITGSGLRQGLETAFRAAELAMLERADRDAIAPYYIEALRQKHDEHLRIRSEVYADAADRLGEPFLSRNDRYVPPEISFTR